MDGSIEKYKVTGSFCIWKYNEPNPNKRHWNFTCDNKGCQSLLGLLKLMVESEYSSHKEILTTTPTDLQIAKPNDRNAEWKAKEILEIKYLRSDTDTWELLVKENKLKIILGTQKIHELTNAVTKLMLGEDDFAIADANDENILYFWVT